MTHPSPTALEERKLGYWYVEDADGAIARIQSGIASTRLYEYGGELPYIFGGLGRSYAQGIADAHNKRIAALEAERDELRQDHAAIFNALFGEDGKYSGTVVPKLWRYVKNAVETIGDLDEAKKKAEAQLATRLPDRQALANVLRGLKFSKYTARTIILDDGRTGYQLMADTANYVAGEIHSALLSGAATAKQPVLPERLVDAADTYFDTYSPKSCISRESVRGGMWLCPVCNHGWHDEDENDHADDCPVKIIRELRERRAATPAPTAALTEDIRYLSEFDVGSWVNGRPLNCACPNIVAGRMGRAALEAGDRARADVGDNIDRGLILLRLLNEAGLTVSITAKSPPQGAEE